MNQQNYYAVIPAPVRYCKDIADGAKLLYGEITALSNQNGYCWATNAYFAGLYDVSEKTISRWISSLAREGFVITLVDSAAANSRKMWLAGSPGVSPKKSTPMDKNVHSLPPKKSIPMDKNVQPYKENNTKNNTKEEEEKNASLSSSAGAENFSLEAEKEKNTPLVAAAPPVAVTVHDHTTPNISVTVHEHITHKGYPTQEPHGEWKRVDIPAEVETLKTDQAIREAFAMGRKIPSANYNDYLEAFRMDIAGRAETYASVKQLRAHFLNWSGTRFEIQQRKAQEAKPANNGQPGKIRQL